MNRLLLDKEVINALNAMNYAILAFERYITLDDEGQSLLKKLKEEHINYGKALIRSMYKLDMGSYGEEIK